MTSDQYMYKYVETRIAKQSSATDRLGKKKNLHFCFLLLCTTTNSMIVKSRKQDIQWQARVTEKIKIRLLPIPIHRCPQNHIVVYDVWTISVCVPWENLRSSIITYSILKIQYAARFQLYMLSLLFDYYRKYERKCYLFNWTEKSSSSI